MIIDPIFLISASLLLSYVFVVASWHKWQDLNEFEETLRNYRVLPDSLVSLFSRTVPVLELLCGIGLLIPQSAGFAAVLAGGLLLMYIFAIGLNLARGRRSIDCGCGGSEQKQSISEWLIVRNGLLLIIAGTMLVFVQSRQPVLVDWLIALLAAVVACLFYNIFNQLLVNRDLLKVLRHHG